ncbi:hypothetical protein [Actinoplanes xinjiangensis]|uniref:Uncharacterized protein n=1 Tax=Actinoplanes xinjiangensis TaxID=512350 RepID=A0A316E887_9ACTN|nr:hypothetical protein [Actinoplanes xinjiangensis]PWK26286.1 hypothetical protein BC793_1654 [Actinoplanes xinjiangensis]GIF45416.1 hypothetical protein Axi01nite_97270 [Actinoplanes xinjiangensis]
MDESASSPSSASRSSRLNFGTLASPTLAGLVAILSFVAACVGVFVAVLSLMGDQKERESAEAKATTKPGVAQPSPSPPEGQSSPASTEATGEIPASGRRFSFHLPRKASADIDGENASVQADKGGLEGDDDIYYETGPLFWDVNLHAPEGFYGVHDTLPPQEAFDTCRSHLKTPPANSFRDMEYPRTGGKFCFVTSSGRMAFANITGQDDAGINLTVRVWPQAGSG